MRSQPIWIISAVTLLMGAAGCSVSSPVATDQLIEHQATVDFHGLESTQQLPAVSVLGAAPRNWTPIAPDSNPFFTHQQWHSPTKNTGVGIVFLHLPLPISESAVLWLAEQHFKSMGEKGRLLGEWTDSLHRSWFEAENSKYRARGYVIMQGANAWIVYLGYKTENGSDTAEINLAARSVETIVPMSKLQSLQGPDVAEAARTPGAASEGDE
jgi:hypothetical protein